MQRSKYRQIKASLMKMPNVIGVGKGYKTIDGLETDQECVVVLVEKKVAPEVCRGLPESRPCSAGSHGCSGSRTNQGFAARRTGWGGDARSTGGAGRI